MVANRERQWSVYRCSRGCVHVTLGLVTLKLSEAEAHALQRLLGEASRELCLDAVQAMPDQRTH
jgi:hypothetical protein